VVGHANHGADLFARRPPRPVLVSRVREEQDGRRDAGRSQPTHQRGAVAGESRAEDNGVVVGGAATGIGRGCVGRGIDGNTLVI
jgi:hypothetical protein